MALKIKVAGTWRDAVPKVKVSGTWRNVSQAYVKVSGAWKALLTTGTFINARYGGFNAEAFSIVIDPSGTLVDPVQYSYSNGNFSASPKFGSNKQFFPNDSDSSGRTNGVGYLLEWGTDQNTDELHVAFCSVDQNDNLVYAFPENVTNYANNATPDTYITKWQDTSVIGIYYISNDSVLKFRVYDFTAQSVTEYNKALPGSPSRSNMTDPNIMYYDGDTLTFYIVFGGNVRYYIYDLVADSITFTDLSINGTNNEYLTPNYHLSTRSEATGVFPIVVWLDGNSSSNPTRQRIKLFDTLTGSFYRSYDYEYISGDYSAAISNSQICMTQNNIFVNLNWFSSNNSTYYDTIYRFPATTDYSSVTPTLLLEQIDISTGQLVQLKPDRFNPFYIRAARNDDTFEIIYDIDLNQDRTVPKEYNANSSTYNLVGTFGEWS